MRPDKFGNYDAAKGLRPRRGLGHAQEAYDAAYERSRKLLAAGIGAEEILHYDPDRQPEHWSVLLAYDEHMRKLAEVGAALCVYAPGAGDPERWPEAFCDCKALPDLANVLAEEYKALGAFVSERTGCVEVRQAYRALKTLREARTP